MRETLNAVIDSMEGEAINPIFFLGDKRFSLKPGDYSVRGVRKDGISPPPATVMFDPKFTNYGVVLCAPRDAGTIDVAVSGFNIKGDLLECLQFQGGKGRYRELSPLSWERALLDRVIAVAVRAGAAAVTVVPAFGVECDSSTELERILKRYDENAESLGFSYSFEQLRYVLEIRSLGDKVNYYREKKAAHRAAPACSS